MCPLEAYVLQVNVTLLCNPKEAQNNFNGLLNEMFPPGGMTCPTQSESLAIFKNRIKTHIFNLYLTL